MRMQKKVDACKSDAVSSFMMAVPSWHGRYINGHQSIWISLFVRCHPPILLPSPIFFRMTSRPLRLKGERRGSTPVCQPSFRLTHFQQTHSPPLSHLTRQLIFKLCFVLLICIIEVFELRSDLGGSSSTITLLSACSVSKFESSHHTQIPHGIRPPVKIPQIRNSISSIRKV